MEIPNFKFKKIQDNATMSNKFKKPICNSTREAVARICTNRNCNNSKNQILCGISACQCNKNIHNKCFQFINFQCFKNLMGQLNNAAFKNIFQKVLTTLKSIAQTTIQKYNEILQNYQTYYFPVPLLQIKKTLNKEGVIEKKNSLKLKEFFNQFQSFFVPNLRQIQNTNFSIKGIQRLCDKYVQDSKQFYKVLFKQILSHQKDANQVIRNKNISQIQVAQKQRKQRQLSQEKNKNFSQK